MIWTAIWQSIILGAVQGLTEFLPVSSSGHLSLVHMIFEACGLQTFVGNELFFDIMLHVGTLAAVVIVLWKDILALFQRPFKTLLMLIVATIPAGIAGLLLQDLIDGMMGGSAFIFVLAACFAVTALLLIITEYVAKKRSEGRPLGWRNAAAMGVTQVFALLPGISRSGSTIAAGVISGGSRSEVARFSFLMSIPIILGSAVVSLKDVVFPQEGVSLAIDAAAGVSMAIGVVVSAVCGFFAVKFMLRIIEKANYKWFSLYLTLLAVVCISLGAAGVLA